MIRTRLPGGVCTPAQWLALDEIARPLRQRHAAHHDAPGLPVPRRHQDRAQGDDAAINAALIDTIAACGDVNRNVLASANPCASRARTPSVYDWAKRLSEHLLPQHARLPRDLARRREGRGHARRPSRSTVRPTCRASSRRRSSCRRINDVDVFAQDLGFIAIVEKAELAGLQPDGRRRHGRDARRCRRRIRGSRTSLGFLTPDQLLAVAEAVVTTQRDFGDRTRPQARAAQVHDRRPRPRLVRGGDHAPPGLRARARAAVRVHDERRPLRLDRRRATAAGT